MNSKGGNELKRILYIGWTGYGNLGDELMFDLFRSKTTALGEPFRLDAANNEYRFLKNARLSNYDLVVLGGGSLFSGPRNCFQDYIFDTLHRAVGMGRKVMIWGSGADSVPKSMLASLERDGGRGELPLKLPDAVRRNIREVFEKSVWAGVRGPLTLALLQRAGAGGNLHVSGDPAFLLDAAAAAPPAVRRDQPARGPIVGVNWGTSFNRIYGGDEAKVENELASALARLLRKGYTVYFYVVWRRDLEATQRLYNKVRSQGDAVLDPTLHHQNELIALLSRFAFTINFKLHANYISLAAQVPFIALGYRFKVFDFAKSVGLEDFTVATDDGAIGERIGTLAERLEREKAHIAETMETRRAQYAARINEPFEHNLFL